MRLEVALGTPVMEGGGGGVAVLTNPLTPMDVADEVSQTLEEHLEAEEDSDGKRSDTLKDRLAKLHKEAGNNCEREEDQETDNTISPTQVLKQDEGGGGRGNRGQSGGGLTSKQYQWRDFAHVRYDVYIYLVQVSVVDEEKREMVLCSPGERGNRQFLSMRREKPLRLFPSHSA